MLLLHSYIPQTAEVCADKVVRQDGTPIPMHRGVLPNGISVDRTTLYCTLQ